MTNYLNNIYIIKICLFMFKETKRWLFQNLSLQSLEVGRGAV
ncbi:hypothetical protein BHY_0751 [Borrelia nietonii YOR]|uniref:Variable outer membrane protein n=1 Tax=Borrelia nietonii YOR TaxID=1293576 RepID=A0ABM5PIQ1_9SPIR|nr:hypothetical protein BHY_0751 [Borrelia nietonii YOR]